MRKVNWENVRYIINCVCMGLVIVIGSWTGVMLLIYANEKNETLQIYTFVGLGITIASIVIGCITSLIDFIPEHKKRKKLEYVQQQVIIEEDVVV